METQNQDKAPAQKRLACDRCHARKLRCLRGDSMAACSRCIHDGFDCTYSPPLKSGRPKKSIPPTIHNIASGTPAITNSDDCSLYSGSNNSSSNSSIITPRLSYMSHVNTGVEAFHDRVPVSDETDILTQIDDTTLLPSTCPTTPESFAWLDLLKDDEGPSLFQYHHHNNHISDTHPNNRNREIERDSRLNDFGLAIARESDTPNEMPWSQSSAGSNEGGSRGDSNIAEVMQTLSRLQQELLQFKRPCSDIASDAINSSRRIPQNPVSAVLKPGQELLNVVRRLFDECAKGQHNELQFSNQQMIHLLVLTPLSLLVSAYSKVLWEITSALHQFQAGQGQGTNPHLLKPLPSVRDFGENRSKGNLSIYGLSHPHCPSLGPEEFNLTLGEMDLDGPLQLVLVITVVKHHLTCLDHALHVYQTKCMQAPREFGISEGLFSTTISELRSSMKVIISEAGDLL
ncbi:hypothetical protein L228DRAFT_284071 [Xylona heveae TC161]|uniref:Zn(2)-C6 fungal-type domain-containing protein n=1 Tax=Xylona heveae (strain CBS 132557 / TC161) TaxID=1328760 RepID=A0A165FHJ1_XYLHT|nr:hypothetical protein L228DRAFT_284071 [Xylona heveae TC161]KZF20985.1 hypothetical protein L228DRAFT_284071 [Xylona heveae TC161]